MTRVAITEHTTVPLFIVIAAAFAGTCAFGGGLMWVAAISTRAETAHARIDNTEKASSDNQALYQQLSDSINQLKASTGRIEGKLEVILKIERR